MGFFRKKKDPSNSESPDEPDEVFFTPIASPTMSHEVHAIESPRLLELAPPSIRTTCVVSPPASIAQVRSELTAEENQAASDEEICRYIRAAKHNLPHAVHRLQYSLAWHRTQKPHQTICLACQRNPASHYMHSIGYDKLRRPIIYSCFARASNHDVEDNRIHMIQSFAEAIGMMPPGVESWTWITDFYGFSTANLDPRIAKSFLHLAANYYPERLGLKIVLGAPNLFSAFWAIVKPLVDPVSQRKMNFWPYKPDELRLKMSQYFDDETISWLLEEMRRNRGLAPSEAPASPSVSSPPLKAKQRIAALPVYKAPEAGCLAHWDEHHDCRGTRQFAAIVNDLGLRAMVEGGARPPAELPRGMRASP